MLVSWWFIFKVLHLKSVRHYVIEGDLFVLDVGLCVCTEEEVRETYMGCSGGDQEEKDLLRN